MRDLSAAVAVAVGELDPFHERNTSSTWWTDLGPWHTLDSTDRLRLSHDQLLVLEVQAGSVITDLRGMLRLQPVGSIERPHGYSPAQANSILMSMSIRRSEMLVNLGRAERVLRPRLKLATSSELRAVHRQVSRQEWTAQEQRVRLTELLTPPADHRHAS